MTSEQKLFDRRQYTPSAIAILLVVAVFVLLNLYGIGGESFLSTLNLVCVFGAAVIAAALVVWNWRHTSARDVSRSIWGGFGLGMLLWTCAELFCLVYPTITNLDTPEVSLADAFWLLGYLPITYALVLRARSLGLKPSMLQLSSAGLSFLLVAALSVAFVILPAIQSAGDSDLFAAWVNMLYPVADLVLLWFAIFIFFAFFRSTSAVLWQVLAIGVILRAISDLFYNYAEGQGLSLPAAQLSTLTLVIDSTYLASYLTLAQAFFLQRLFARGLAHAPLAEPGTARLPQVQGNSDVLLYTESTGKVVSVSAGFVNLVQARADAELLGLPLEAALGLEKDPAADLVGEVERLGFIRSREMTIYTRQKQPLQVWMTAAANREYGEFTGADIVLRAMLAGKAPDEETRALAGQIYARSGAMQEETLTLIKAYSSARIHVLAGLLSTSGGRSFNHVMEEMFANTAQSHHSRLQIKNGELLFSEKDTRESLLAVMPALLQELTSYAESIAGYEQTAAVLRVLESELEPESRRLLDQFGLLSESFVSDDKPVE